MSLEIVDLIEEEIEIQQRMYHMRMPLSLSWYAKRLMYGYAKI